MASARTTSSERSASISDRLSDVDSRLSLHALLTELAGRAADGKLRWTRTQIMFYLPQRWHGAAREYFLDERFRAPDDLPPAPIEVEASTLAKSLARATAIVGDAVDEDEARETSDSPGIPSLEALLAEPAPSGVEPVPQMLRALREEMRAVKQKQPRRYRLSQGRCIRAERGRFVYRFTWSSEPEPFAPGELKLGKKRVQARVGEVVPGESIRYELVVDEWLGPEVERAIFFIDPTFLLRVVYMALKRADETAPDASQWAAKLAFPPSSSVTPDSSGGAIDGSLNEQQRAAVAIATSTDRAYVWGPPGTGKTTTIGALVRGEARNGGRLLILSPYNVAVDEAILSVASRDAEGLGIVRVGRASERVRRRGLDMDTHLERHARESGLLDAATQLLASIAKLPGERFATPGTMRDCLDELGAMVVSRGRESNDPETVQLTRLIRQLRKKFRAPEKEILSGADVLGCTMALAFLKKDILARPFDRLVVDETSVVRTPEATLAATMVGAPVAFFGDPKQLPAIVVSSGPEAAKWIGRSPFALAGIERPSDAGGACIMLEEQHRMAPPVRTVVSTMFYDDALRDGPSAPSRGRVLVLDTSQTGARATPKFVKLSQSKENLIHRAIVTEVLRALGRRDPETTALVLSPFAAQKREYRREATSARALKRGVRFETIHTSQGTEQDVVILDLVLAGTGLGTRSRMLDEDSNPHLGNLLNVALSRAKRTLIVVGDLELIAREYKGELLERLVDEVKEVGSSAVVPAGLRGLGALLDAVLME